MNLSKLFKSLYDDGIYMRMNVYCTTIGTIYYTLSARTCNAFCVRRKKYTYMLSPETIYRAYNKYEIYTYMS